MDSILPISLFLSFLLIIGTLFSLSIHSRNPIVACQTSPSMFPPFPSLSPPLYCMHSRCEQNEDDVNLATSSRIAFPSPSFPEHSLHFSCSLAPDHSLSPSYDNETKIKAATIDWKKSSSPRRIKWLDLRNNWVHFSGESLPFSPVLSLPLIYFLWPPPPSSM